LIESLEFLLPIFDVVDALDGIVEGLGAGQDDGEDPLVKVAVGGDFHQLEHAVF
jgi:hypothetical protein